MAKWDKNLKKSGEWRYINININIYIHTHTHIYIYIYITYVCVCVPGGGNGSQLQYSCQENSMDKGAWQVTVHGLQRVEHD